MQLPSVPDLISSRPVPRRLLDHGARVVGRRRLRLRILDELDREHRPEPADVADPVPALLPREHPRPNRVADRLGPLDEALLLENVEHGERGGLRDRVADVGSADRGIGRRVHDLRLADHGREREPAGDRLRHRHEIRLDAVMLDAPHAPRAAEPRLHLVDDEHDAVLVTDLPHALNELRRRDDEAALAEDRLHHDRGHALGGNLRHERAPSDLSAESTSMPRYSCGYGTR